MAGRGGALRPARAPLLSGAVQGAAAGPAGGGAGRALPGGGGGGSGIGRAGLLRPAGPGVPRPRWQDVGGGAEEAVLQGEPGEAPGTGGRVAGRLARWCRYPLTVSLRVLLATVTPSSGPFPVSGDPARYPPVSRCRPQTSPLPLPVLPQGLVCVPCDRGGVAVSPVRILPGPPGMAPYPQVVGETPKVSRFGGVLRILGEKSCQMCDF